MSFYPALNQDWHDGEYESDMGVGETGTILNIATWWNLSAIPFGSMRGVVNMAVSDFSWSVSDESIAYLRDDYPGTDMKSIVALKVGFVTVTITGPLGRQAHLTIRIMPEDVFEDDSPPDPGPTPNPDPFPPGSLWNDFLDGLKKWTEKEGLASVKFIDLIFLITLVKAFYNYKPCCDKKSNTVGSLFL